MTLLVSLDIDGVLHKSTDILGLNFGELSILGKERFHKEGLFRWSGLLESVLFESEMKSNNEIGLIVHSSWRKERWATTQLMRDLLGPLGHRFWGFTSADLPRQESIEELTNRTDIENYIIVDDARSEFRENTPELILTNPLLGVCDENVISKISRWACNSHKRTPSMCE